MFNFGRNHTEKLQSNNNDSNSHLIKIHPNNNTTNSMQLFKFFSCHEYMTYILLLLSYMQEEKLTINTCRAKNKLLVTQRYNANDEQN